MSRNSRNSRSCGFTSMPTEAIIAELVVALGMPEQEIRNSIAAGIAHGYLRPTADGRLEFTIPGTAILRRRQP
jgi:hypothetical protein